MSFQIKDKVFYPGHGVAVVESLDKKVIAGNEVSFFKLCFLAKEMTILVPERNVDSIGVRCLSSTALVDRALNELYVQPEQKIGNLDFTPSGWNKRNKEYQLKIQNGGLIDLAKIYRDLMFVAKHKELSFGERNLLNMTEDLLLQEIVIVRKKGREEVLREIRSPFREYMGVEGSETQSSSGL
jgi:CarD family transcriptional regulator